MSSSTTNDQPFELIAGQLSLDFANSLGGHRGGVSEEHLRAYPDLVRWGQQTHLLSDDRAAWLSREAQEHPGEASAAFTRALTLREALYRVFAAVAKDAQPAPTDLALLNAELTAALADGHIVTSADGFAWDWRDERHSLAQVLGPIARSAADLLTSDERSLVRECASATCSWLFVDRTKNHRRRWCSPSACGNVAKVRSYRARRRSAVRAPKAAAS
jgi:predicted RNA-binding Zn ribbon-like protein